MNRGDQQNSILWHEKTLEAFKHCMTSMTSGEAAPPGDDYQQLLGFSSRLYGDSHESIVQFSISMLPPEVSEHLQEKVPRDKFGSVYKWVFALKREVDNVLLPMVRDREPQSSDFPAVASGFLNNGRILEDLAIEERLDAHIDRAV